MKKRSKPYKLITRPVNKVLQAITFRPLEKYLINKHIQEEIKYPPVFIIGAPRTGSTILYEYITNYLDIAYINNFMSRFCHTLSLASVVSKIIFRYKQHNRFDSKQGRIPGLNSPSECGTFWYRWFPKDRHFVDCNELDAAQIKEINSIVKAVINENDKPLIFKNMNCGQRLKAIKDIFPNAIFVYCKRDPLFVAQSIIETREKVYKNRSQWWSIMPKEYEELVKLDYPQQVVKQIYYIQKQIEEDLELFGKSNFVEVWYEDFCKSPKLTIEKVRDFLLQNNINVLYKAELTEKNVSFTQKKRLDNTTLDELQEIIESMDWQD